MDTPLPCAVLFERALPASLAPLLETRPFGLLPLASGKLLGRSLETLAEMGFRRVDLILDHLPHLTREWVGGGERWGLDVRCHTVRLNEEGDDLPSALRRFLPQGGIALALDLFFSARDLEALCAPALAKGMRLFDRAGRGLPAFALPGASAPAGVFATDAAIATDTFVIDTPLALWEANLDRLANLSGTAHLEREVAPGVFVGSGCRLSDSTELRPRSLLAAGSLLGRRTVLGPEAIVGHAVVLDEGSEVIRSLVFDGTCVGRHALIEGKLVDGPVVVDIASGEFTYVGDPAILAASSTWRATRRPLLRLFERALALLSLALLCLPIAAWLAWRWIAGRPGLETEWRYVPTGRDLSGAVQFAKMRLRTLATDQAHWRRLPWLVAVADGRLRLAGSAIPLAQPHADSGLMEDTYAVIAVPLNESPSANAADIRREFLIHEGPAYSFRAWSHWLARLTTARGHQETSHA